MINTKNTLVFVSSIVLLTTGILFVVSKKTAPPSGNLENNEEVFEEINPAGPPELHPLAIEAMRDRLYSGSDIQIEEAFDEKATYRQYVVSYLSDGFKIYAFLTVPKGSEPPRGWPVIIFNHGSISPAQYRTTERYVAYMDYFASRGYVVFKSDYRGHGDSEGEPDSSWYSPVYVTDVLNGVESVKKLSYVNAEKIGMWGHSSGGHITVSAMVISKDVKAGVIWAGLTATHDAMFDAWRNRIRRNNPPSAIPSPYQSSISRRQELVDQYGTWQENPEFWNSAAPTSYLSDLSGPVQLHHGLNDERVPAEYSEDLKNRIEQAGKIAELYTYLGADHNLSQVFGTAMSRSVQFFDEYLK